LKLVAGTFFGLLAAGLALAFVIELLVDHTVRRPGEFETKIHIPLFLSIPKMGLNGHAKLLPFPASGTPAVSAETAVALHQTWDADHPLRRYIDGLRDRILTHFDGDPHKPKLIGVTSCSTEVGVTSIAAGLAGALSETGDGNVLLLNLNFEAQSVHPFYRGELTCGLSDALEPDKRGSGMVLQNLYVATAGNSSDPASNSLPKQLARVVPKLRVSDYDYIVFDLPPTTPTTMTARLAGLMDLVILVVESEKDTQEAVKEAGKLLSRSKAHVSAVLNKVRNPTPRWLHKGT
jgi:Mrp family chromosome partitioning ATPase